jgi:amidase
LEEITLGPEYDNMGYAYQICDEEVATSLLAHYRLNKADLSQGLKNMVETGGGISHLEAQRYRDHMATLRPKLDAIARGYSATITPSCAGEAPKKDEFDAETRFCGLWTALHVPVISVPGFGGVSGRPIGLSLVGAR